MKRALVVISAVAAFVVALAPSASAETTSQDVQTTVVSAVCNDDGAYEVNVDVTNNGDEPVSVSTGGPRGSVLEPGQTGGVEFEGFGYIEAVTFFIGYANGGEEPRHVVLGSPVDCKVPAPQDWLNLSYTTTDTCLPAGTQLFSGDITATNSYSEPVTLLEASQEFVLNPGQSFTFLRVGKVPEQTFQVAYRLASSQTVYTQDITATAPSQCAGTTVTTVQPHESPELVDNNPEDGFTPIIRPTPTTAAAELPRTGAGLEWTFAAGLSVLLSGLCLTFAARRRLAIAN